MGPINGCCCDTAIRPELELKRTRRAHREIDADDPERKCEDAKGYAASCVLHSPVIDVTNGRSDTRD
jgi:hypothetical protein